MPKINQYYIKPEIKKPVEIVQEVNENNWWRNQSFIKKSSLSSSARSKVINKSGGNFQSEKEGYGPCEYWDCPYSSSCRFYLEIGFSGRDIDIWERYETGCLNGSSIYWITMENIQQARNVLRKFEKGNANTDNGGCYFVSECTSLFSSSEWSNSTWNARKKQREIMLEIKNCIDSHERGNQVYKPGVDFRDRDDGGCSVIM